MRSLLSSLGICLVAAPLLASCGQTPEVPLSANTWQITNVYTTDGNPSATPADVAGQAVLVFGDATVTGNTGCAPLQAAVSYSKDEGKASTIGDAKTITFTELEVDTPKCEGAGRYFHDKLVGVLGDSFTIERKNERELLLTKQVDSLDKPSIRLSSN